MPSFAQSLEKTLHNALQHASDRAHEYATLEHLLLALVEDRDAAEVMTACGVDLGELAEVVRAVSRPGIPVAEDRGRDRPAADRRLPARDPARDPARPVLGQGHRDRRQCAGRAVLRTR